MTPTDNPSGMRPPRLLTVRVISVAAVVAVAGVVGVGAPAAHATGRTVYVSPGGSSLQSAVDAALPGDTIAMHAGTYTGQIVISRSGTSMAPITMKPAGDGPVTVTATFPVVACNNSGPVAARTIKIVDGADYWTISGLRIVNGVWASGLNGHAALEWFNARVKAHDWQARRALPGRGSYDPANAKLIYAALTSKTGVRVDPVQGLRLVGNDITGRGVHVITGSEGEISANTIHDISCGIGPGVWVNTYSDFWHISKNTVRNVAASTYRHFMQEGIRLGSASSYNIEENNAVTDLPGDGRGITTDIDASWNTFQHNLVARTSIAYNDQESGWGNRWIYNAADSIRGPGFVFRGADAQLTQPSLDRSTNMAFVQCNHVDTMAAGTIMKSTFKTNYFRAVSLSTNLQKYWTSAGNTWDGSSKVPPSKPPQPPAGAC